MYPSFSCNPFDFQSRVVAVLAKMPGKILPLMLLAAPWCAIGQSGSSGAQEMAKKASIAQQYGKLPLSFEPNQGQVRGDAQYVSRGGGYGLFLNAREAVLMLHRAADGATSAGDIRAHSMDATRGGYSPQVLGGAKTMSTGTSENAAGREVSDVIRMQLAGANAGAQAAAQERLTGTANYILGNDAGRWRTGIPTYGRVRFDGVYPGVDLVYYGNQRQLEYDFVVAPGASSQPIQLHFDGARKIRLDERGELVITAAHGEVAFHKPVLYQTVDGARRPVAGGFKLMAGNRAGFSIGSYDHTRPLVIDPTLGYSTYLGGNDQDLAVSIALDTAGEAYLTGLTYSSDYPLTPGAFESVNKAESDSSESTAFVTKLNASGTALLYSTYLGGTGGAQNSQDQGDYGHSIAVDSSGDAYVAGVTFSADFPVTKGAYQTTDKAADNSGATAFISKLNSNGTGLVYSTYLGGSTYDDAFSIAIDSSGDAYVAGLTFSSDFPVTSGAYQKVNKSADADGWNAFVTKLNASGSALDYSTFLGGSGESAETFENLYNLIKIAIDKSGDAYVEGYAQSTDFPVTSGAYQKTNKAAGNGGSNITVTKLNSTGAGLVYSTYLGGSSSPGDLSEGIALDSAGNAYVTGYTSSTDFPVTGSAFQKTNKGAAAGEVTAFATKLNTTGSALSYSTYLGGSDGDAAYGVATDSSDAMYVTGITQSTNFPVTSNAYQAKLAGTANVFLTELNTTGSGETFSTYLGGKASDAGYSVALGSGSHVFLTGYTTSSNFPVTKGAFEASYKASKATVFVTDLDLGGAATAAPTTTALKSSLNPAAAGEEVTFTADVAQVSGTGTPTGNVVFSIDEKTAATVALSAGKASYSTASLAAGAHYVLASYAGSTAYGSSGGSLTETITAAAATPVFSPAGGSYTAAVKVTITDATSGATIYYTTNGDTPTSSSTKYTGAITVDKTTTIKAIAEKPGEANSGVASATYTITASGKQAATPVFKPAGGVYTSVQFVTITDTTSGATIYYTTSGATPTASSTKYTGAITVAGTETVKAIAVLSGDTNSAAASATYTIVQAPEALAYPATAITSTGATLNALVNTGGIAGSSVFKYGTSSTALTTTSAKTALSASTAEVHVTDTLTTLKAGTTYYFEVVVTTAAGVTAGEVLSFKTE